MHSQETVSGDRLANIDKWNFGIYKIFSLEIVMNRRLIILKGKRIKMKQLANRLRRLREDELIKAKRMSTSLLITYICIYFAHYFS